MTDFAAARTNMIESQVRPNGITDRRIIAAMEKVARETFVPDDRKAVAYVDEDVQLAASGGFARYLIEAMAFARLLQNALIKPTDKVLIIGAGTGYGAAVVSALAAQVVAVESDAALAAAARHNLAAFPNVKLMEGSLAGGATGEGPFDVILIEGRIAELPQGLLAQLAPEGRLAAVVGETEVAKARVYSQTGASVSVRDVFDASVAPLPGFDKKKPAFVF
jgi:protein-L-isoaspartate(D-aspartate) O-methyltransferase